MNVSDESSGSLTLNNAKARPLRINQPEFLLINLADNNEWLESKVNGYKGVIVRYRGNEHRFTPDEVMRALYAAKDGRNLVAENDRLRGEVEKWERLTANIELPEYPFLQFQPKDLGRENAKLRKLVAEIYEDECMDSEKWRYRDRLSELGIEVDE